MLEEGVVKDEERSGVDLRIDENETPDDEGEEDEEWVEEFIEKRRLDEAVGVAEVAMETELGFGFASCGFCLQCV